MPEKYARVGLAIVVDALAMTVVTAVLASLYWLVTGAAGEYLAVVSNMLFFEGGIILVFGALIELFRIKGTKEIRKLLFSPRPMLDRLSIFKAAGEDKNDDEKGAAWLLIFLGALLIVFSILTSLNHLI